MLRRRQEPLLLHNHGLLDPKEHLAELRLAQGERRTEQVERRTYVLAAAALLLAVLQVVEAYLTMTPDSRAAKWFGPQPLPRVEVVPSDPAAGRAGVVTYSYDTAGRSFGRMPRQAHVTERLCRRPHPAVGDAGSAPHAVAPPWHRTDPFS